MIVMIIMYSLDDNKGNNNHCKGNYRKNDNNSNKQILNKASNCTQEDQKLIKGDGKKHSRKALAAQRDAVAEIASIIQGRMSAVSPDEFSSMALRSRWIKKKNCSTHTA